MSETPDHRHHVRRVILPSGKTIEVVYFEGLPPQPPAEPRGAAGAAEADVELHVCGACRSELVYPVDWEEHGSHHWRVELRCPNCGWAGSGIFAQETVERFDEQLDRGTESLVRDLKRLMQANMEAEAERFIAALRCDGVLPEDF